MKRIPEEERLLGSGVWPYNGWYPEIVFGLNPPRGQPGFEPVVADVHTCMGERCGFKVLHVGVGMPELMLISIHNACGTKAYVGPVFSYHEFVGDRRWSDREWSGWLEDTTKEQPPRPAWLEEIAR